MIPTVAFGEGGLDRERVDVIAVRSDGLSVLKDGGDREIPLEELAGFDQDRELDHELDEDQHQDQDQDRDRDGPLPEL